MWPECDPGGSRRVADLSECHPAAPVLTVSEVLEQRARRRSFEAHAAVQVLSVPFGGGHRSVAEATCELLQDVRPSWQVAAVDALEAVSHRLNLSLLGARIYFWLVQPIFRPIYRLLFKAVDKHPRAFGALAAALFQRRAQRWLTDTRPQMVVSTYPLMNFVLGRAIAQLDLDADLITLVTDAGSVNRSWFHGPADLILVTDADALAQGEVTAGPSHSLIQISTPLRAGFANPPPQAVARKNLGLGTGLVALAWGGGQGMATGMTDLAKELVRQQVDVEIVFVTGGNAALASRLRQILSGRTNLVFETYWDVPSLLSAVDIVIGKSGWLSLEEAAFLQRHTLCIDALPGQELENLRVHVQRGTATHMPNVKNVISYLNSLASVVHRDRLQVRVAG